MRPRNYCMAVAYILFSATALFAQNPTDTVPPLPDTVSYWKTKLKFGVNLNQASFSSNWKGGGVNSVGLNSLFNLKAIYAKDRHQWDNEIDLLYGFVNNEGQGFRKTLDRIYLDTKYGYKINTNWDLFTSLNFISQFTKGYQYTTDANGAEVANLISDIFAPAFITSAWGAEYHPVSYFKVRMSPFAPRITIVNDPERFITTVGPEPYGVKPPDEVRIEWLSAQLMADFNTDIAKNLTLKWRYMMYANYEDLQLKTIDHRFDLGIIAKVNKFIDVGFNSILLYDYDQDSGVQLSQALTLGFQYGWQNYKEPKP